ncbi:8-amino-7-oxononanoate synthase [Mucilaginibacter sp.]|uniref:aminotransferase class I/II-fold pyridoxal phosphate-dependent enzyme n=1 Tax=Mucilaginibacter sp. TaxID=1882438 RepID=UPI00261F2A14|nr:8-amino-7-oxononanoate synthase [Mucilaginibacter sp.]MDB4927275.1 aminotransferase class I/II-fold pyridoxal phosphate-dependent enzyme [Mucilaginibacter sp.]
MASAEKYIEQRLNDRRIAGSYRILKPENSLVDFCSNDYLGFSRSSILKNKIDEEINNSNLVLNGATGSRLISGNLNYTDKLEKEIADLFNSEAGLLFNSGYDANLGLLSSLPQRGDTIITDELIHASIIDGARLSHANRYTFKHNDIASLEAKLKQAKGNCYVVIESVYSMDGDTPPIIELLDLTEKYGAHLIVDEAHAVGLYKTGIITRLKLEKRVFARIVTFGKALGCHGAVVLGNNLLREYLINFARSFIYTTAAPLHQLASIKMACKLLQQSAKEIAALQNNINLFKQMLTASKAYPLINSESAIQCILLKSNEWAKKTAMYLQDNGLDVRAILSPTVAQGSERIRICLHAFNTVNDLTLLTNTINNLLYAG